MLGGVDRGECRCSTCEGVGGDTLLRGRLERDEEEEEEEG